MKLTVRSALAAAVATSSSRGPWRVKPPILLTRPRRCGHGPRGRDIHLPGGQPRLLPVGRSPGLRGRGRLLPAPRARQLRVDWPRHRHRHGRLRHVRHVRQRRRQHHAQHPARNRPRHAPVPGPQRRRAAPRHRHQQRPHGGKHALRPDLRRPQPQPLVELVRGVEGGRRHQLGQPLRPHLLPRRPQQLPGEPRPGRRRHGRRRLLGARSLGRWRPHRRTAQLARSRLGARHPHDTRLCRRIPRRLHVHASPRQVDAPRGLADARLCHHVGGLCPGIHHLQQRRRRTLSTPPPFFALFFLSPSPSLPTRLAR